MLTSESSREPVRKFSSPQWAGKRGKSHSESTGYSKQAGK